MTPFRRMALDAHALVCTQNDLLSRPREFFAGWYRGRVPTAAEKLAVIGEIMRRVGAAPMYQNDTYTVQVEHGSPFVHLQIRRNDWGACKDWRDFQEIKNLFVGAENEAVELFPADSRLVDTANVYHLWVHVDPQFRFPFGLPHRMVTAQPVGMDRQRARQQVA